MKARANCPFTSLAVMLFIFAVGMVARGETKGINPSLMAQANAGSAEAQYQIGTIFLLGDGVQQDYAQAAFWFHKGAAQGDADSEFQLGGLYHLGQGVPQDSTLAFTWAKKAADQGHLDAAFFIATSYSMGWGVPPDDVQAAFWRRRAAAESGDPTLHTGNPQSKRGHRIPAFRR